MEIRVHGSHMSISDELRAITEDKVARAARVFDDAQFVDVEFTEEQNPRIADERFRVEITTSAAGHTVRVESADFDDRAALDRAVDILERNLRRLKERLISRNRKSEKRLNEAASGVEEEDINDEPALRIERVKRFAVKPMTPEEAVLQMETLGHSFYLFLNADTDTYSVLYRRKGGTLGLIEPQ